MADGLRRLWSGWQRFGRWMGDQVARVFLVAFYFTVMLPFGLIVRRAQDPLGLRPAEGAGWTPRRSPAAGLDEAERPY